MVFSALFFLKCSSLYQDRGFTIGSCSTDAPVFNDVIFELLNAFACSWDYPCSIYSLNGSLGLKRKLFVLTLMDHLLKLPAHNDEVAQLT